MGRLPDEVTVVPGVVTPVAGSTVPPVVVVEPELDERERVALALPLRLGSSAAPTMRACASACTMRAAAAAMSRLTVCASSISAVSSRDRKSRHQSSAGGASIRKAVSNL